MPITVLGKLKYPARYKLAWSTSQGTQQLWAAKQAEHFR